MNIQTAKRKSRNTRPLFNMAGRCGFCVIKPMEFLKNEPRGI